MGECFFGRVYAVAPNSQMTIPIILKFVPIDLLLKVSFITHSGKKSLIDQENAYSNGCKVKYLLKSQTSVHMVEFNSQSPF